MVAAACIGGAALLSASAGALVTGTTQPARTNQPAGTTVTVGSGTIAGLAPSNLGGPTVRMAATVLPVGVPQKPGTILPAPLVGSWTVSAGASYREHLGATSPTVASWAKANGGVLNVQPAATGSTGQSFTTAMYHPSVNGDAVTFGAPLAATSRWSGPVADVTSGRPREPLVPLPLGGQQEDRPLHQGGSAVGTQRDPHHAEPPRFSSG